MKLRLGSLFGLALFASMLGVQHVHAADTIETSRFLDTNANGTVETIRWDLDENITACTYEAGDWTVNTAGTIGVAITGVSCTPGTDLLNITVTATASMTSSTTLPVISYANQGTADSITLASGAMSAKASVTATDGAAPIIRRFDLQENTSGPNDIIGYLGKINLVFTETVTAASTLAANNLTFSNVGDFTGAAFGSSSTDLITTGVSQVTVTLGTASTVVDTDDDSGNLAIATTGTFNLTDGTNTYSTQGAQSQATFVDDLNPAVKSYTYKDNDGDGKIDRITVTFSETVDASSTVSANDMLLTAGDFTGAAFGSSSTDLITGSVSSIDVTLGTEATAVDTHEDSEDINVLLQNSFSLTAGVLTTADDTLVQPTPTFIDGAAPVVASVSPADGATGFNNQSNVVITFSEPMVAEFVAGDEISFSSSVGSMTPTWSNSNTVVTLDFTALTCGTTYTFDLTPNEIEAAQGTLTELLTTGPQDDEWSFTTVCGSSNVPAITPSGIGATYSGPICTTTDRHAFTLSAQNATDYMVSDSNDFLNAEWLSFTDGMSIEATLADADTAYFLFKSGTATLSNTTSVALNDWSSTCASTTGDGGSETPAEEEPAPVVTIPLTGLVPGDVILSPLSPEVYYVTSTYGRRVFINEDAYFTWFDSFDVVKNVSIETLSALPLEGTMLPKSGVVLVKIQSAAAVYVLDNGDNTFVPVLRQIPDEVTAAALFGSSWADYVIDIEPTFFTRFEMGNPIAATEWVNTSDMKLRVELAEDPDADGDGLTESQENIYSSDPHNADTDGDGYPDGLEVANGYSPLY